MFQTIFIDLRLKSIKLVQFKCIFLAERGEKNVKYVENKQSANSSYITLNAQTKVLKTMKWQNGI